MLNAVQAFTMKTPYFQNEFGSLAELLRSAETGSIIRLGRRPLPKEDDVRINAIAEEGRYCWTRNCDEFFVVTDVGRERPLGTHPSDEAKAGPYGFFLRRGIVFFFMAADGVEHVLGAHPHEHWEPGPRGLHIWRDGEEFLVVVK